MSERPPYKLRDDLIIKRRVYSGEIKYVVKDPLRMQYFTIAAVAYELMSLCDGKRDLDTLLAMARKKLPTFKLDAAILLNFYETLKKQHFLEDAWNRNVLLIEKQRRSREKSKAVNPAEVHLASFDPDGFLNAIVKHTGFLFTKPALVVYALLTVAAFSITFSHAEEFKIPFAQLWTIPGTSWVGLLVLWAALLATALLHELGHGLTTKHFGGEVHKIGFMLLYFNPCFFCDVTESLFFEKKAHKQAVTAAGGIVNLVTASLAIFVWFFTARDLWVNQLMHRVALYSGLTTVIFNLNPLSRYDGYFLLSQHLDMPNLQQGAFHFLGQRIRALLGLPLDGKPVADRDRRIYWIYGIASAAYLAFAMTMIYLALSHWLIGTYRALGYALAGLLLLQMSGRYRKGLWRFLTFAWLDKGAAIRRRPLPWAAGALVLLLALLFVPLPRTVPGAFRLEPARIVALRAPEAGVIEAVYAEEGDAVAAGAPVLAIRQDEIGLARRMGAAEREGARAEATAALIDNDPGLAASRGADAEAAAARERFGAGRESRVRPAAPFGGVVLTPDLRARQGLACAAGDTLCEVGDLSRLHAEVLVDELMLGILDARRPVELRTQAPPFGAVRGRVLRVAPEPSGGAERRLYRVVVEVVNPRGDLRPGMRGEARLGAKSASAIEQLGGWLVRILRVEFWV